jgi:hypothetical protein
MGDNMSAGRVSTTRRAFLSASAVTAAAVPFFGGTAQADTSPALVRQEPDEELRTLLRQVDPGRIEATVRRLVQFGTRHTASSQTDPVRGIGAATDWVYGQMQAIAATSAGNMTVQKQTFVQPVANRIPVPTTITNVIATLRGHRVAGAVLRGDRPPGLAGDRRAELHQRRPGRR